jgi:hypothetical protein
MSVAERHRGHLRAARCLAAGSADTERVAAHLLVVERLADPWVVVGLRAAAHTALDKGAPGSSVTYLERALAEPVEPAGLSELLADRVGLPTGDLAVALVENSREDWSFGRGQASYLELPRQAWR